jgi:hypothetical protein
VRSWLRLTTHRSLLLARPFVMPVLRVAVWCVLAGATTKLYALIPIGVMVLYKALLNAADAGQIGIDR